MVKQSTARTVTREDGTQAPPGAPSAEAARLPYEARLPGLQVLRGVAALLVLFHHYVGTSVERGFAIAGFEQLQLGNAGTDIFFVISGFIMEYLLGRSSVQAGDRGRFLLRRAVRILPLYWSLTLAAFLIATLLPALVNSTTSPGQLLLSMLLLPDGAVGSYVLPLAWTLSFELLFYLLFALFMPLSPSLRLLALGALFLPSLLVPPAISDGHPLVGILLHPLLLEFLAGAMLARLALRGRQLMAPARAALVVAGVLLLLMQAETLVTESIARLWTWGLPALLIVAGTALGSSPRKPAALSPALRMGVWLGDISYALYLSHFFALALFSKVYFNVLINWKLPPVLAGLLMLALCLAVAQVCYLLIEQPARRWGARLGRRSRHLAVA